MMNLPGLPKPKPVAPTPAPEPAPAPRGLRDHVFFLLAACSLSAAMLPPDVGSHEADAAECEKRALALAALFDRGDVPEGFVLPHHAVQLREIAELVGPVATPGVGNAFEVQQQREKLERRIKNRGPLPDAATVRAESAAWVERIQDLSEPVRHAALTASCLRLAAIAARASVLGTSLLEQYGVCALEILRAIRFAEALEIPARADVEGLTDEIASRAIPYPGSVAVDVVLQAQSEIVEMLKAEPVAAAPDATKAG